MDTGDNDIGGEGQSDDAEMRERQSRDAELTGDVDAPADAREVGADGSVGSDPAEAVDDVEVGVEVLSSETVSIDDGSSDAGDGEEADLEDEGQMEWYILKVQVNREDSIREGLERRIKLEGLEEYFSDIVVPTEDVAEFNKAGKRRVVKKKLYPGYIMVCMIITDDTWFLVRETPGIGDFTGSGGKPTPMDRKDVERIIKTSRPEVDDGDAGVKIGIPFKAGDRVRVKDGYFQNFEGGVEAIDEANGRVTVMINIFGRSTPVELEHWQIESL